MYAYDLPYEYILLSKENPKNNRYGYDLPWVYYDKSTQVLVVPGFTPDPASNSLRNVAHRHNMKFYFRVTKTVNQINHKFWKVKMRIVVARKKDLMLLKLAWGN